MNNFFQVRAIVLFLLLSLLSTKLYSQSDYELVQTFKESVEQMEDSINSVKSLEELKLLAQSIDRFRNEYLEHKELLDKSLYPKNFDQSFEKLNLAYVIRSQDFKTINILQTENIQLKEQVSALNKRNSELMNKIQDIELSVQKNDNKTDELRKLVTELKISLNKRDELIYNIVDSLMPKLMKKDVLLNTKEKGEIFISSEKNNLVENIIKSLQDNIRFIYMTTLAAEDLRDIKKQQMEFSEFWQDAGPNLIDIYISRKNKAKKVFEIDSLYTKWLGAVETAAWINIRQEFTFKFIQLEEFYSGKDFTRVIRSYIDDEIRNIGVVSDAESAESYEVFADDTWNDVIKKDWIPFLIKEKILEGHQLDRIEAKIGEWQSRLSPKSYDWIYIVVIIAAIAGLLFMNRKRIINKLKSWKERNK